MMMNSKIEGCDVLLIGYEDEENLGLRYIAAYLEKNGVTVGFEPFTNSIKLRALERILEDKPKIVGFSLIFQRMLFDFANLIAYLRIKGVTAHFTMGGHFPTLEFEKTLELIPELNTIIRHEGEHTLLELFENLDQPQIWPQIKGLAFRMDGRIVVTQPRPLILNLDSLPFPVRRKEKMTYKGIEISSILASRGCFYNCSFCSVHTFYLGAPGPKKRLRSPSNVAEEMEQLFNRRGTRIFIFKDDDLGMRSAKQKQWAADFAKELKHRRLHDKIIWRVSCRVDEVTEETLAVLKEVGLRHLYLGIESGTNQGLKTFNKIYKIDHVFRSLAIIQKIGTNFEYGFMILDPDSTFDSIRGNVDFLERISEKGKAVVHFTKMFPYIGTSIYHRLEKEGRLGGTIDSPNYSFIDSRLDLFEYFLFKCFDTYLRIGLAKIFCKLKFHTTVLEKFFPDEFDSRSYSEDLTRLINISNNSVLSTIRDVLDFMEERSYEEIRNGWEKIEQNIQAELNEESTMTNALYNLIVKYEYKKD
jgi:anaerobic magnesium-protoporphyrin IX monomethyl ester cyclase